MEAKPAITHMGILRLWDSQVDEFWELVKTAASFTLRNAGRDAWERLYIGLKTNYYEAYWLTGVREDKQVILGLGILQLGLDSVSGERHMNIWSLFAYEHLTTAQYREAFAKLWEVAKERDCNRIVAVSAEPAIIEVFEALGADTSQRFMSLEVK